MNILKYEDYNHKKKNTKTKITDKELKTIKNYNLTHNMCYNKV